MKPLFLIIALIMPAMVLSGLFQTLGSCFGIGCEEKGKGSEVPAQVAAPVANPEGHQKVEHNPYMQVLDELGELWSKLYKLRLNSGSSKEFSVAFNSLATAIEKVQEFAVEIATYYDDIRILNHDDNHDHLKGKARIATNAVHDMQFHYQKNPEFAKFANSVNELAKMSLEIDKKVEQLPDPKVVKNKNL